jgi:hypothetical protein
MDSSGSLQTLEEMAPSSSKPITDPLHRRVIHLRSQGMQKGEIARKLALSPTEVERVLTAPGATEYVDQVYGELDLKWMHLRGKAVKTLERAMEVGGRNPDLDEMKLRVRAAQEVLSQGEKARPKKQGQRNVLAAIQATFINAGGESSATIIEHEDG